MAGKLHVAFLVPAVLAAVTAALALKPIASLRRAWAQWRARPIVLRAANGAEAHILPVGAVIQRLFLPDKAGVLGDVVLGFDSVAPYQDGTSPYFGAVVGRCANRIAGGRFTLEEQGGGERAYQLATNNGPNHLHGGAPRVPKPGERGFDKVTWRADEGAGGGGQSVRLTHSSPDGEEASGLQTRTVVLRASTARLGTLLVKGYPGAVEAAVTYALSTDGDKTVLAVTLEATCDRATLVNMTQHSYFNLAGHASGDILDHELTLLGRHTTPVDSDSIPTGEVAPVAGTRFDFTTPRRIGDGASEDGFDHNFVLHGLGSDARSHVHAGTVGETCALELAAVLAHKGSGRTLRLLTNAPGLQLYTANYVDGVRGKGGAVYGRGSGLCLEPQAWPDAVHQPRFPSTVLLPGETYRHQIVYEFSTWVAYPTLS